MQSPTHGRSSRLPSGAAVGLLDVTSSEAGAVGGGGRSVRHGRDPTQPARSVRPGPGPGERRLRTWGMAATISRAAAASTRTALPDLSAVRGDVWTGDHGAARRRRRRVGAAHPGRHGRRVLEGLHLPEGLDAEATPRGSRTGCASPMIKRDGVHVEATWAEAWAAVERGLGGVAERARPRVRRGVRREPVGTQPVVDDLLAGPA